jgi:hypothetical protein
VNKTNNISLLDWSQVRITTVLRIFICRLCHGEGLFIIQTKIGDGLENLLRARDSRGERVLQLVAALNMRELKESSGNVLLIRKSAEIS